MPLKAAGCRPRQKRRTDRGDFHAIHPQLKRPRLFLAERAAESIDLARFDWPHRLNPPPHLQCLRAPTAAKHPDQH